MTTPRYSIPELAAAQAQKHVTVNEALRVIDAAMNLVVASRTLTDPPADPGDGDKYIPSGPAGGAWTSHENEVAAFVNGQWRFFAPEVGWRAFDQATARLTIWDGAEWADFAGGGTQAMLGINTAADATNRLAVKSDAVLFSHDDVTPGTGDIRFVVNKAAVGNTASLLFQTGYSGRGEVGLAGSDALELKASADGVAFDDILSLDPASHSLALTLDGVERLRVNANGFLGIGTTTPVDALHVATSAVFGAVSGSTYNANVEMYTAFDQFSGFRFRVGFTDLASIVINGASAQFLFDCSGDFLFRNGINGTAIAVLTNAGTLSVPGIYSTTTASAANVFISAAGLLQRSTSSAKYKADILDMSAAERGVLMDLRPVSYLSTCEGDDPKRRHFGLIAEEVIEVSPSLVHPGADGSPEGVMYERIVPHLIAGHQNHEARIAALEAA